MSFTYDRFGATYAGGVVLPTTLHPFSDGPGAIPSSMVELPGGGAWDSLGSGIARPRYGLVTHRGKVTAATAAALLTAVNALKALNGKRDLLWKSSDGGTTNRSRYARVLDVRADWGLRNGTPYAIVEMDFELAAGVWSGALRYGVQWILSQQLGTETHVLSLARCADGSMVAGTGPNGQVYRSTDNGVTWTLSQQLGAEIYVLTLSQCADGSMIVGTYPSGQVYRSTDNGVTWILSQQLGAEISVQSLSQCADGSMIVGTYPSGQVCRSTDNGVTWTLSQRLGTQTHVLSLARRADGSMVAGTGPNGQVYRSTDNGVTWTLSQQLGAEIQVLTLAQCADGSMVAGTYPTGQVYRSTDNGVTWTLSQRLGTETQVLTLAQCADGSMVAGTYPTGQVYGSIDNGVTWILSQQLGMESHVYSLAQCADGSMIAGTYPTGQVYRSGGAEYTILAATTQNIITNNRGNARVRDAIITITASGTAITKVTVWGTYLGVYICDWDWTGTLAAGKSLIINCGTKRVTNNGVDAYVGLVLNSTHPSSDWLPLDPGVRTLGVRRTGGDSASACKLEYADGRN